MAGRRVLRLEVSPSREAGPLIACELCPNQTTDLHVHANAEIPLECQYMRLISFADGTGEETKGVEVTDSCLPLLCCVLGIPADMPMESFNLFIEAYAAEIESCIVLSEPAGVCTHRTAVLAFRDNACLLGFCQLYNDLHFPEFYDQPPCLVFPLERFDVVQGSDGCTPRGEESLLLPHCASCLRRIALPQNTQSTPSRVITLPMQKGNEASCAVCRAYTSQAEEGRRCFDCGLSQNIWVCMACARGGCGRYTYMHAKEHYHATGHPFSLELATGRIWDYVHDAFVHHEDRLLGFGDRAFECSPRDDTGRVAGKSSVLDGVGIFPPLPISTHALSGSMSGLDDITTQKISNVVAHYESLMQSQLADQSIHYEKLLARKTVQLLEQEVLGSTAGDWDAVVEVRGVPIFADIEKAKMEISALERDHACLLQRLRVCEDLTRKGRQENKNLIENQKTMQIRSAQLKALTAEAQQRREEKTAELQEQIRDLEFFMRTQAQVQASSMRDDIQNGNVVVLPGEQATPTRAPRHRNSNSSGKRRT